MILLGEKGNPTTTYTIPGDKNTLRDLQFRASLTDNYQKYTSWAVEFSEPTQNLSYRISEQGKIPEVLHWDGSFTTKDSVQPNHRYFARLLLILENNQVVVSPWTPFEAVPGRVEESGKIPMHTLDLYVVPDMGLHLATIKTRNMTSSEPTLSGDIRFIWSNKHTLGFGYEATSKGLLRVPDSASDVFYSEITVFYRYRLLGAPTRAPWISGIPPEENFKLGVPAAEIIPAPPAWNLEVGTRFYSSVLRGQGNRPIDGELARSFQGLALTANADRELGFLRLHAGADFGFSFISSKTVLAIFKAALTYEKIQFVSPGLLVRYHMISGKPSNDPYDSGNDTYTDITNQIFFAGLTLNFKL